VMIASWGERIPSAMRLSMVEAIRLKSFRVMRLLYLVGGRCQGVSVILEEKTTSGAEVFPVSCPDGRVRGGTQKKCRPLADLLLRPGIGVDEDEDSFPVVITDEDLDVVVDPVVVDDVVHASIVLRKWQGVKH